MKRRVTKRLRWGLSVAILVTAAVTVVIGWRYIAFQLWVEQDASQLRPYPTVLINENGSSEPFDESHLPMDLDQRDREVALENARGRYVVHLSRSDYRRSFFGNDVWVKVYLETRLPDNPAAVQSIKFLNHLARRDGQWVLRESDAITIP